MKKIKVYDLPTRFLHWLFAALFVAAFAIAKLADDESVLFSQHMLLGIMLTSVAILRLFWGIIGSRYARFFSFPLNPLRLIAYFKEILNSRGQPYPAHNPASAWATLIMIALTIGLGATGYLMATGQTETYEEIHELLANTFAFVVVAHIAGIILHQLKHRDAIALSMIHGKKESESEHIGITKSHRFVAISMAGFLGLIAFQIYKNYDTAQSTTSLFGIKLQLGENESDDHENETKNGEQENDDDD